MMNNEKNVLTLEAIRESLNNLKSYHNPMKEYASVSKCDLKVGDEIYYLDENNPIIINKYKYQLDDVMKNFDIFLKEFDDERN